MVHRGNLSRRINFSEIALIEVDDGSFYDIDLGKVLPVDIRFYCLRHSSDRHINTETPHQFHVDFLTDGNTRLIKLPDQIIISPARCPEKFFVIHWVNRQFHFF